MISTKAAALFKHFGPIKREVTGLRVKVYDNALTSNQKFMSPHKRTLNTCARARAYIRTHVHLRAYSV